MLKKPQCSPPAWSYSHLPTLYLVNKVQLMMIHTIYQFLQNAIMFVLCIADSGSLWSRCPYLLIGEIPFLPIVFWHCCCFENKHCNTLILNSIKMLKWRVIGKKLIFLFFWCFFLLFLRLYLFYCGLHSWNQ